MTDKPYRGRRGGRYVRTSRNEPPRPAAEVADEKAAVKGADKSSGSAGEAGKTATETAAKPARKRN